jgi:hypothetical protein
LNGATVVTSPNLDEFLIDHDDRRWSLPDGAPKGLAPASMFLGPGTHGLEVAVATATSRPRAEAVRKLWHARWGRRPSPLLLVVAYEDEGKDRATVCGPAGDNPPLLAGIELSQAERLCSAALQEANGHGAIRFLIAMLPEIEAELPGIRNTGMLALQELRRGVPERPDWLSACAEARPLLKERGRGLVEHLGFNVEMLGVNAHVLTVDGAKQAVAVFLDDAETFEDSGERFSGATPVAHALALADRENLPWVVLTRGRQIRLYSARPDVGVGRKGRAETYLEVNLALLPEDRSGFLTLLFSADALRPGGTFDQILEASSEHAADLGARLRERVYFETVPRLATAIAKRLGDLTDLADGALERAYDQTLVVLFRLLFVAYGEDKDLLPYRTNSLYADHSLKRLARHLAEMAARGASEFDGASTSLWDDVRALWDAVDRGNKTWGVPPYNGGLFSKDPVVHEAGAAVDGLALTDEEFGPALAKLLVDEGDDGVIGPVDFRSLSVREFGTIYEGLLESELSVAPANLTEDKKGNLVPALRKSDPIVVSAGDVYFHNRSGIRKSTGSYFTKPFAVEHLLDHALEPEIDDHLARVQALVDAGDEAAASDAFFDFRCVDIAMGSGHFLVAAVDRIEARLSAFLALQPIATVIAELERLRAAAYENLGELASGYEIDQTSLLRRLVARRCIYGVDLNRIAVELARLAMWIHTFVPGLPLSFLDHNLRWGSSLTGIGTLDEALAILEPKAKPSARSLMRDQLEARLGAAGDALRRLGTLNEATSTDVAAARKAHADALAAVEPTRRLFDLLVAVRIGEAIHPEGIDEERIAKHRSLLHAEGVSRELQELHFPVAFPEVFLRDRPGFDCILGNPPWEKVHVEEHSWFALRFPGLRSLPVRDLNLEIARFKATRPDLVEEYEADIARSDRLRAVLLAGPYPELGRSHPDLYKAFAWRFWQLCRDDGSIGVVLPRVALSAAGSAGWREFVLENGTFTDVAMFVNNRQWVFDDVHPQYTIGLISIRKGEHHAATVALSGPYASLAQYLAARDTKPLEVEVSDLRKWSSTSSFPLLPTASSGDVFAKLRAQPSLASDEFAFRVRFVQGDLNATTGKKDMVLSPRSRDELWPVYKGASFNVWEPDTGEYYAWGRPAHLRRVLQEHRVASHRRGRSAFSEFPLDVIKDVATLPCLNPRIAYRRVARATDTRTVIAALVPPNVALTDKAAYIVWPRGSARDEAYLLGVLCSYPLDWYARRVVETQVDFHVIESFPIPNASVENPLRHKVVEIAGRLAAVDGRYTTWAASVGVPVGGVGDVDEKTALIAELDAAVAMLYELAEADVHHIFETFHAGWDYRPRLEAVLEHFRRLAKEH